jgi:DNA (cytosine-5)-methyltransferase 1
LLNGLDLFSGIGGLSLALGEWVRPVAYCECDRYCQGVLLSRMRQGAISEAPIWDDVRSLKKEMLPEIQIIYGGFPCQDISVAGLGKGLEGERSGLFFEVVRLTREIRPRFVFLENVPAITTRGLTRITAEFSALRYDCRWGMLSAFDVGAPHLRQRWFMLAHASGISERDQSGWRSGPHREGPTFPRYDSGERVVADTARKRGKQRRSGPSIRRRDDDTFRDGSPHLSEWWKTEPDVGRVVDELPFRVDRLRALGNAVVPSQAREAFTRLMGIR